MVIVQNIAVSSSKSNVGIICDFFGGLFNKAVCIASNGRVINDELERI
jgi:hypothetical protein